jgi:hypothetical protein
MAEQIPSKLEVVELIRRHIELGYDYRRLLDENLDSFVLNGGNFKTHYLVRTLPEVAAYFSPELAAESASIDEEESGIVSACEKETFQTTRYIRDRNFPWFEGLDLGKNLTKQLTFEQMMQYQTRGTSGGLSDYEIDRVQMECLNLISKKVAESCIYNRKINLEQRMVNFLLKNNPELKTLKCEFFSTEAYLKCQKHYVPNVWSEFVPQNSNL